MIANMHVWGSPAGVAMGPATLRMPTKCQQNPNFFKPSLRSGLKQRQEAAMRDKMQDKQKKWEDWEKQVEEEERLRKGQPPSSGSQRPRQPATYPNEPTEQYQRAYQDSEVARTTKESQLDDIQRRLQERVRQRQRGADRWMPTKYVDVVAERAAAKAAEEQARAAAREARRQQEAERAQRNAADAAAASQFLQGRVRQKAFRFSELVDTMQERQEEKNPYRSRQEDESAPQESRQWGQERAPQRGAQQQPDRDSYLPPDVIRVSRRGPANDMPEGVWVAGSEGAPWREPAVEEAEWEREVESEEGEARRKVRLRQQSREEEGEWNVQIQAEGQASRGDENIKKDPLKDDSEYIDW